MMLKSIRWRLPFSYAAIALLAALVLGLILLLTLRGYYGGLERDYLNRYGGSIGGIAARMLNASLSDDEIEAQFASLSFLSQTRLRLLDSDHRVIVDTETPNSRNVLFRYTRSLDDAVTGVAVEKPLPGYASVLIFQNNGVTVSAPAQAENTQAAEAVRQFEFNTFEPSVSSSMTMVVKGVAADAAQADVAIPGVPFGLDFGVEDVSLGERSTSQAELAVKGSDDQVIGYLQLSEGPAFGSVILSTVARGWALACILSVLVAAAAGWFISRTISRPLLDLTHVTETMAGGNLSVRADIRGAGELGQLAESFNRMVVRVEDTITALRRFVADAAHELHTPITALNANLELAASEADTATRAAFIERAREQVERLEALTAGLLDLSRLESRTHQSQHTPTDLTQLIHAISEPYASRAEQAGLSFALDVPDTPVTACVDEGQLRRVIGNLLDNAIKFTPEGEVRIGLRPCSSGVELWVEDTGIGIPPEDRPYLFNRFHRARNAAAYPGSGLGLAIIKAIVDSHDGSIDMISGGSGTRFSLRLPA